MVYFPGIWCFPHQPGSVWFASPVPQGFDEPASSQGRRSGRSDNGVKQLPADTGGMHIRTKSYTGWNDWNTANEWGRLRCIIIILSWSYIPNTLYYHYQVNLSVCINMYLYRYFLNIDTCIHKFLGQPTFHLDPFGTIQISVINYHTIGFCSNVFFQFACQGNLIWRGLSQDVSTDPWPVWHKYSACKCKSMPQKWTLPNMTLPK